jgi:hypothetical protein
MPAAILHPGMAGNNGGGSQVLVQILHQNENPEFTGLCFKEIGFNFLIFSRSRKNIFCIVTILKKPQGKDTIAPRFF